MTLNSLTVFFADAAPAAATVENPTAQMIKTFGLMAFMVVVFYLLMIRPQQKKQKEHALLLKTVKPGDKISTTGGILGVVVSVREKSLTIRSADSKFEINKSAIAEITERSSEASAS